MKKMIFLVALTIPLMSGTMFTGYRSSTEKKETARIIVQDARQDLNVVQKDTNALVQKVKTTEEWKKFNKSEFELKIMANERRITELNEKIKKTSELFDRLYLKRITDLEKENRFLKSRLGAYEKNQLNM